MTTAPAPSISTHELTGTVLGPFATVWKFNAAEDVRAYVVLAGVRGPNLTQPGQFTVTGATPTVDGGSVTLNASVRPAGGWPAGSHLVLRRRTAKRQGLALPDVEGHKPRQTEQALDRLTRMSEEQAEGIDLALTVPVGEAGLELPSAAARRGKLALFGDAATAPLTTLSIAEAAQTFKGDPGGNAMAVGLFTALGGLEVPVGTDLIQTSGHSAVGVGAARYAAVGAGPATAWRAQTANGRWFELLADGGRATVQAFGARGVADDHAALLAALTWVQATGGVLVLPAGQVNLWQPLTYALARGAVEALPGAVLNLNGGTGGQLHLNPGVTALPALTADVAVGAVQMTFAAAHGLAEGDAFCAFNPTDGSLSDARDYYYDGAAWRVLRVVNATTVRIRGTSLNAFDKDDVTLWRYAGARLDLDGLTLVPTGLRDPLVWLDGFTAPSVRRMTCPSGAAGTVLELFRCAFPRLSDLVCDATLGDAYPVILSNCPGAAVDDVRDSTGRRHIVALGGRTGNAAIPTSDAVISRCHAPNDATSGIGAFDVHGGCVRSTYQDGECWGVNPGGFDTTLRRLRVHGRSIADYADGLCIYGNEVGGGHFVFEDLDLLTEGDGLAFGIVHLNLNNLQRPMRLTIRRSGITHRGLSGAGSIRAINLYCGETEMAHPVEVHVEDLSMTGAGLFAWMAVSGAGDQSDKLSVFMRGLRGPAATQLVASAAANYGCLKQGTGVSAGYRGIGDASVTLDPRADVRVQSFDGELTAPRTVDFNEWHGGPGDEFVITRRAAGAGTLTVADLTLDTGGVGSITLAQGESVHVAYSGASGLGRFAVVSRGRVPEVTP